MDDGPQASNLPLNLQHSGSPPSPSHTIDVHSTSLLPLTIQPSNTIEDIVSSKTCLHPDVSLQTSVALSIDNFTHDGSDDSLTRVSSIDDMCASDLDFAINHMTEEVHSDHDSFQHVNDTSQNMLSSHEDSFQCNDDSPQYVIEIRPITPCTELPLENMHQVCDEQSSEMLGHDNTIVLTSDDQGITQSHTSTSASTPLDTQINFPLSTSSPHMPINDCPSIETRVQRILKARNVRDGNSVLSRLADSMECSSDSDEDVLIR